MIFTALLLLAAVFVVLAIVLKNPTLAIVALAFVIGALLFPRA